MKTTVRLIAPSFGWTTIELVYHTNPVGSNQLYKIDEAWQTYRGERHEELDVNAVLSYNPYEEIEEAIIAKTQSSHRRGLELDNQNPRINFKLKNKTKHQNEI